jgi:Putative beta-barrel porin-2, OmpL-like. bbp2
MNRFLMTLAASLATPVVLAAQSAPDTTTHVTFGGFVDAYYAYDAGRPTSLDRSFASGALFTTQPARHDEFNVNLAFVEAKLDAPRVHGRLAVQYGTSVQSNYAAEPRRGAIGGPGVQQFLQEAYAGYRVARTLWVDGGIFFSNIGEEGWISRDNPTYTRSLVADYSPYYSSGVRALWQATPTLALRLDVVNGWQNISETNQDKGVGVRADWTVAPGAALTYYDYVGNEIGGRLRTLNGVGANVAFAGRWKFVGEADLGTQQRADDAGTSHWYGVTAILRAELTPKVGTSLRVERYDDRDQVILATGDAARPFRGNGASVGVDVQPEPGLVWRTELRGFANRTAVFPNRARDTSRTNGLAVTSLALTF